MKYLLILFFLFSHTSRAELVNKIIAVLDDKVITLAQAKRVLENLKARKTISPLYIRQETYSVSDIAKIEVESYLIRDKLAEMGYVIDDVQVENQIKETERRLNLTRDSLLQFLTTNNMTFSEYFELVRQSIELNIFNGRVIEQLITITDQEIKNTFYKKNMGNNTFTFKYVLEDFAINKDKISSSTVNELVTVAKNQRMSGVLPPAFSSLSTNNLGDVTEDTLSKDLNALLKNTNEGDFTNPILLGDFYHVFYIQKKDLVESEIFNQAKNQIRMEIYNQKATDIVKLWMEREASKHFVKYFN